MPWSEFLEWLAYFETEWEQREKTDYYMAQVALEIRRSKMEDPNKIQLSDMLLKFEKPETGYERMMRSKRTWADLLGIEIPE